MKMLASVLLVAVGAAIVMVSDLFIRAKGLDGVHGIDASSYDSIGSVLIGAGLACVFITLWKKD